MLAVSSLAGTIIAYILLTSLIASLHVSRLGIRRMPVVHILLSGEDILLIETKQTGNPSAPGTPTIIKCSSKADKSGCAAPP